MIHPEHTGKLLILNAAIVLPDRIIERGSVRTDGELIAEVNDHPSPMPRSDEPVIDAGGAYLIPGIVDLHNDNLEHEIHPRANANLPIAFALSNMERRLAGSGITTEFHAISFQDNVAKQRSIDDARGKAAFLMQFEDDPRHGVRHHILHRLDVRTSHSIDHAMPTLLASATPYASLNDHTPGQGQYRDVERLIQMAHTQASMRSGRKTDPEWYRERMRAAQADQQTVPAFYQRVGELMATTDLVLSTHDDDTSAKVDEQLQLGATVSEFPVTIEAAEHARRHNMAIVVGAPNIVRGGSQSGNLSARDLVAAGLADIICADYHAPSLLPAAWMLHQTGLLALPRAVCMVTRNAAHAIGLTDRGEITPGKLADLALVRVDRDGWPHAEATIVGGRHAYHFVRHPELERSVPELAPTPEPIGA